MRRGGKTLLIWLSWIWILAWAGPVAALSPYGWGYPAPPQPSWGYYGPGSPGAAPRGYQTPAAPRLDPRAPAVRAPRAAVTPGRAAAEAAEAGPQETRILLVSGPMGKNAQRLKLRKLARAAESAGMRLDYRFDDETEPEAVRSLAEDYQVILFDSLQGEAGLRRLLPRHRGLIETAGERRVLPVRMPGKARYRVGVSNDQAERLAAYFEHGGMENFRRFFDFLAIRVLGLRGGETLPPLEVPRIGIFHPDSAERIFRSREEYLHWYRETHGTEIGDRPIVGLAFHRAHVSADNLGPLIEVIRRLEARGAVPYPFYTEVDWDEGDYLDLLLADGAPVVDVILNFQVMIIEDEAYRAELERIDVPVLHALAYRGGEAAWQADTAGIPFARIPMYLTIPEAIGFTDPLVVTAVPERSEEMIPIQAQLDSLIGRALNTARLRRTPAADRRVAILFYNYPPASPTWGRPFSICRRAWPIPWWQ